MKKNVLVKGTVNMLKALLLPLIVYGVFFVLCRILSETTSFGLPSHMKIVFQQTVPTLMVAFGISFNLLAGRWDFSYGGVIALASIIGGQISNRVGLNAWQMLFVCMLIGMGIETLTAVIYTFFRVPCIVVSLGMVQIFETATNLLFDGSGATIRGKMTVFGRAEYILTLAVVAIIIHYIIMANTRIGYNIRSVGNGQEIAKNIGVRISKNAIIAYVICGAFLGIAGFLNISVAGTQRALMNLDSTGLMFDAMICVIIGTYLNRYCNISLAIVFSTLTMKILGSGLLGIGASAQIQQIVKGFFLLAFITFSTNQARIQRGRELRHQAEAANRRYRESLSNM